MSEKARQCRLGERERRNADDRSRAGATADEQRPSFAADRKTKVRAFSD